MKFQYKVLYALLIFLLFVFYGCRKTEHSEDTYHGWHPEYAEFIWYENKKLVFSTDTTYPNSSTLPYIRYYYYPAEGNNRVFIYRYHSPQCDYLDDEDYTEILSFEINKNTTQFEYIDSVIAVSTCSYQKMGFVYYRGSALVKNGILSGKLLTDSTWEISASLTVMYPGYQGIPEFTPRFIKFKSIFSRK